MLIWQRSLEYKLTTCECKFFELLSDNFTTVSVVIFTTIPQKSQYILFLCYGHQVRNLLTSSFGYHTCWKTILNKLKQIGHYLSIELLVHSEKVDSFPNFILSFTLPILSLISLNPWKKNHSNAALFYCVILYLNKLSEICPLGSPFKLYNMRLKFVPSSILKYLNKNTR